MYANKQIKDRQHCCCKNIFGFDNKQLATKKKYQQKKCSPRIIIKGTHWRDNEPQFKVTTIQCDMIYNPISIIIDDDMCASFLLQPK